MKLVSILGAVIGLTAIAALVVHFGADAVAHSLTTVGGKGFVVISFLQLILIAWMGIAWSVLLPRLHPRVGIWARLVRDSAAEVLPLSQIGGYVLGARALTLAGVSGGDAAASTIVDVTLEFLAQLAFTLIAVLCLLHLDPNSPLAGPAAAGLTLALALAGGFLVAQRCGVGAFEHLGRKLGGSWAERTASGAAALHDAIAEIYARRTRVWTSFVLHLACWMASVGEVWLALQFMDVPRPFGVVLVIESLLYAARSAAFAVPNAMGVQEGAYVLLGAGFGLTPEAALALSRLKRGRDLVIGLPVLGAYQLMESGRLWRRADGFTVTVTSLAVKSRPR